MLTYALTYTFLALGGVVALATMILRIGKLMSDCPEQGTAARVSSESAAAGFAAIGTGGVILIGAGLPFLAPSGIAGLFAGLGLAALCLGLGFTQAIATLRAIVRRSAEA